MSNRRNFIKSIPVLGAGLAISGSDALALNAPIHVHKRRNFRIAHLTDIHVEPGSVAPKGMAKALQKAQTLPDK
ncbi:MAG: metallophosphoesterase, partial [Bacteroidia bacterium]|nr:metallophosphoesterase [Bacteroidia bacterium]